MRPIATACLLAGLITTAGMPVAAQDEDLRMGDDPAYLERVEVPEAGVAVSYPAGWEASVEMEYGQRQPGDPYSGYWSVVRGFDDASDSSCSLDWELYPGSSMLELAEYGEELRESGELDEESFDLPLFDVSTVELPAGTAVRTLADDPLSGDRFATYELDHGGTRYSLTCFAENPPPDEWLDIAETLELLPADERLGLPLEPPSEARVLLTAGRYELERVELPEVGIAMQLPAGWELEVIAEERELALPPDDPDAEPLSFLQVLYTEGPLGDWCSLQTHRESTLDVHEQADLQAAIWTADAPAHMHALNTIDFLAGGLARHVDLVSETNPGVARAHIIDVGPVRQVLTCGSDIGVSPSWRDMADTIELLEDGTVPGSEPEAQPPEKPEGTDIPEGAVASNTVGPYTTVVPVTEDEEMTASCTRALWIEYADGSFEERIECVLSYDPVGPDYVQGIWPLTDVRLEGGACEWYSDFWSETDDSVVWAESWEITAETDGHVGGRSWYGPSALECDPDQEG